MAFYTDNLHLIKPTQVDFYNVADYNENFEKLDTAYGDILAAISGIVGANLKIRAVILRADSWNSIDGRPVQAVNCNDVVASEGTQIIIPVPLTSSNVVYYDAGIVVSGQVDNGLVFTATSTPSADVSVRILLIEAPVE